MIITGDNILTAIKVGLTLNMGTKEHIVEVVEGKIYLESDGKK